MSQSTHYLFPNSPHIKPNRSRWPQFLRWSIQIKMNFRNYERRYQIYSQFSLDGFRLFFLELFTIHPLENLSTRILDNLIHKLYPSKMFVFTRPALDPIHYFLFGNLSFFDYESPWNLAASIVWFSDHTLICDARM
jgi:hypothetical protein